MTNNIADLYNNAAAIIDLSCLSYNLGVVKQKAPGKKIIAMIKANAYGHGMVRVAKHFISEGVDYLGVAFVEEGVVLRNAGIKAPILVTGAFLKIQIKDYLLHNIDITVSSLTGLEEVEEVAKLLNKKAKIHLQVDTGMMRVGVRDTSAPMLMEAAARSIYCDVISVYSHFATADGKDLDFANNQLERLLEATYFYEKHDIEPPFFHIANSAGVLRMPESHLDAVRPGIMLYGYHPSIYSEKEADLLPALSLRAKVTYFKVILKGSTVGYGRTWISSEDTRSVTLLIGYGDGYCRGLSNNSEVLIHGNRYPVIGNISMDHTVVSLGKDGEAYRGDEAILIGTQGNETITANELAEKLGTINYEILTSIGSRVPRVYIN
ncbi:MAG: alr [Anaerocolumna sp.]|jgi:alanine racemase|nr:alr [Anaerocolumna sp.]